MDASTSIVIRPPFPDEGEKIGSMMWQIWRATYMGLLPDSFWQERSESSFIESWRESPTREGLPDRRFVVAVDTSADANRILGLAISWNAREHRGIHARRPRELHCLYARPDVHGIGLGQRLFDAVTEPDEPLQLWVATANPRARSLRFYQRNGFRPLAETAGTRLGMDEVMMVR